MTPAYNQQEFIQLIEDNKAIIYKICHSYCSNSSKRNDLAQEIVYQLWKSASRYKPGQRFSTWMYRVALNTAISFYRKEKNEETFLSLDEHSHDIEDQTHTNAVNESNLQLLEQFISRLKELDRALMLLYLEEKSYQEIAEIMGISISNVSTRINRIKEKLRKNFSTLKS